MVVDGAQGIGLGLVGGLAAGRHRVLLGSGVRVPRSGVWDRGPSFLVSARQRIR